MTVIDAEGEPMEQALRATPDLVSPNSAEAEQLVGHEFRDDSDHVFALYELCERGPREAIMTHAEAAMPSSARDHERSLYELRMDSLEPVSAIGAGDAFLAGYLAARYTRRERTPTRCASPSPAGRVDTAPRRRRARRAGGRAASSTRSC